MVLYTFTIALSFPGWGNLNIVIAHLSLSIVGNQLRSRTQSAAELMTEIGVLEGYKPWQLDAGP